MPAGQQSAGSVILPDSWIARYSLDSNYSILYNFYQLLQVIYLLSNYNNTMLMCNTNLVQGNSIIIFWKNNSIST